MLVDGLATLCVPFCVYSHLIPSFPRTGFKDKALRENERLKVEVLNCLAHLFTFQSRKYSVAGHFLEKKGNAG